MSSKTMPIYWPTKFMSIPKQVESGTAGRKFGVATIVMLISTLRKSFVDIYTQRRIDLMLINVQDAMIGLSN